MIKNERIKVLPEIYSDVFISLGVMCRPAYWLQRMKLRKCALPLDWMKDYKLDVVLDMIKNKNINYFSNYTELDCPNGPHRRVKCNLSQIISIHHFPIEYSVEEYLPTFLKIFNNRKDRFYNIIKKTKKICFITNRTDDISEIIYFLSELHKIYPHTYFTMINVRRKEQSNYINKYTICKNVILYDYVFEDIPIIIPEKWIGDSVLWKNIMKKLHLNNTKKYRPNIKKHKYF